MMAILRSIGARARLTRLVASLAVLAVLVLASAAAEACPSCKTALATDDGRQGDIVGGFMWSILFMLSMPFACVTGFSTYMYVLVRRARAHEAASRQPHDGGDEGADSQESSTTLN